jgi:hypothetical protein
MTKKVTIGTKPRAARQAVTPDEWVATGTTKPISAREETMRFTIDIPVELHARIKSQCALRRVKMREEILALLERHFAERS